MYPTSHLILFLGLISLLFVFLVQAGKYHPEINAYEADDVKVFEIFDMFYAITTFNKKSIDTININSNLVC